jgi:hypothetical protein
MMRRAELERMRIPFRLADRQADFAWRTGPRRFKKETTQRLPEKSRQIDGSNMQCPEVDMQKSR